MAVIDTKIKAVKAFEGLHLYHGNISNCSMRVRMTLEEKDLDWVSHHIDLKKKENITDEYFGINPNGLVPTLIHDGVIHIESNDIIDYLDKTFPEPPLRSTQNEAEMLEWLKLSASLHVPGFTESKGVKNHPQLDIVRAPALQSRILKRDMVPEDLVGTLLFFASEDSDFLTGQSINVDGGKYCQ